MTIKKAKAIVKGITDKIDCNTVDIDDWAEFWGFTREEYEEFLDNVIKAIEQETCYDAISREELLKAIDTWDKFGYTARYGLERLDKDDKEYVPYIHYDDVIKCIKGMPSAKQEPKTGHWVEKHHMHGVVYCSECDFELRIDNTNYCPNCGLRMIEQ